MFISRKEIVLSMEEVLVALKHMQHENQSIRESTAHLQRNQTSTTFGSTSKEP
jgi:hypothetical protein